MPDLQGADPGGSRLALERIAAGLVVNPERMKANLEALQGLVFSERLARVIARDTDRASALAVVDDWSAIAVTERRHLRDIALARRPELTGQLDEVFSLEAIIGELRPVLDETLAGITADAGDDESPFNKAGQA